MKRRIHLSVLATLFALLALFSVVSIEAASWPSVSSRNYCEFVSKKTIYVYKDTACRTRGTISPSKKYNAYIAKNDVCYVYKFTNNYLQVSYPTSSGRKVGYIKRSDFVVSPEVTEPGSYSTARGKATTYKYTGGASYGYTETGDGIYSLGTSDSYTAIIYTARSGNRAYKYAFVRTTDYNSLLKNKENDDYALPAEGLYTFQSAINKEKVIDVSGAKTENGTNVGLWKSNGGNHQKFNLRLESDGWYKILDCNSGKALDVKGGSTESGANVQIWTSNSNDQQLWKFYSAGNGYYFVKNKLGNYLDLSGGIAEDGRNIQVWTGNNSDAQKWYLERTSKKEDENSIVYPFKSYRTSQSFGNYSSAAYQRTGRGYHCGIDIVAKGDTNVYAAAAGKVIYAGYGGGNGYHVVISHTINGYSFKTLYSHMKEGSISVSANQNVSIGTKLGVMGSTGVSSGDHLHFGVYTGSSNNPYGYTTTKKSSNILKEGDCTFYNPVYVIKNQKLP